MYNYFIVYFFKDTKTNIGCGHCTCERNMKIMDIDDINDIENNLKEKCNFTDITILNYILLSENKKND